MPEPGEFQRLFFDPSSRWTWIGTGAVGGKAAGLVAVHDILQAEFAGPRTVEVSIPTFTVVRTDVFDAFVARNRLRALVDVGAPDDAIAQEFQRAPLPAEILGDLRALVAQVTVPLAVRSSSLMEDALGHPFAGIYATKMIPNNQPGADARFHKLMEAIKLVYASAFFRSARDYLRAAGCRPEEEKMAVVIQEVVGSRHGERFYPDLAGVARSFNYYPSGRARREDGVVSLALGLGKTIVDGDTCWTYSPERPASAPPFSTAAELLEQTQTRFWAVNMGKPPAYDPIRETEYLVRAGLQEAEEDGTLRLLASTYDAQSDRIVAGTGAPGARVLNFAGVLTPGAHPLNPVVRKLLAVCQRSLGTPVEIEFAMTADPDRIGFLQVRPMVVPGDIVTITDEDFMREDLLIASDRALGNGTDAGILDIVYVKPDVFEAKATPAVARELERINRKLLDEGRGYLLIGFGRWGSSDPWLGIPVNWGQVSGARAIVEATIPAMNVELSQGSHFFHNLLSFRVYYFSVPHTRGRQIRWDWLRDRRTGTETEHVRHVRLDCPLGVRVDGRSGRGIVAAEGAEAP